jgi:8-oxo-dGTP pyrophosphatase MutT (NUDIX family)
MTGGQVSSVDVIALASDRLRSAPPDLREVPSNPRGDHDLNPDGPPLLSPACRKPAAVLVPVVLRDEPTVLFTERASGLREHSGQIAFPGGKVDREDPSPLHTALREAEEEIGLDRQLVQPAGYLDPYLSSTNYMIMPVVGFVTPRFSLALNPFEVSSVFEAPLRFLMDPKHHEVHTREWRGRVRSYYAIPYGQHYIWGVTAGILRNLYERLVLP